MNGKKLSYMETHSNPTSGSNISICCALFQMAGPRTQAKIGGRTVEISRRLR